MPRDPALVQALTVSLHPSLVSGSSSIEWEPCALLHRVTERWQDHLWKASNTLLGLWMVLVVVEFLLLLFFLSYSRERKKIHMTFYNLQGKFINLWKNCIGKLWWYFPFASTALPHMAWAQLSSALLGLLCVPESWTLRVYQWGSLALWLPAPYSKLRTTFSDSDFIPPGL